jgi:hypothetical protein
MQDPLLKDIRRARAQRSKELARDVHRALQESYERSFTLGHDVVTVDPFTGEVHVLFVANPGKNARPLSGLERILERKRNSPTRAFRLEVLRNRGGRPTG